MRSTSVSAMLLITFAPLFVALLGCGRGPKAIPSLSLAPNAVADRALELLDANNDDILDKTELEEAPGLAYASKRADANADFSLDRDEIVAIVDAWNKNSIGLLTLQCTVTLKGRPLAGADIRLEPEPFMDGKVEAAIGRTDEFGYAFLTVPKEKRPIADAPPGAQLGLYRVMISKKGDGKELVPSKYNTETILGQEVAFEDPGVMNGIKYKLK